MISNSPGLKTESAASVLLVLAAVVAIGGVGLLHAEPAQPVNLSARTRVQTGDSVGIAGFTITGTSPKHIVVRALGPSLKSFGITGALADPTLEVHYSDGTIVSNDNWKDNPAQQKALETEHLAPSNDLESAIDIPALVPGQYSAVVR